MSDCAPVCKPLGSPVALPVRHSLAAVSVLVVRKLHDVCWNAGEQVAHLMGRATIHSMVEGFANTKRQMLQKYACHHAIVAPWQTCDWCAATNAFGAPGECIVSSGMCPTYYPVEYSFSDQVEPLWIQKRIA